MYVRCADCQTATRLELGQREPELRCRECAKVWRLDRLGDLGATPHERYQCALAFAGEHDIDLASAYSVLLGIMTLKQSGHLPEELPIELTADSPVGTGTFDPGFARAVAEGHLSVRQAVERGDRVTYASWLARKFRLSMNLAFQVTDNRIPLREAIAARKTAAETHRQATRPDETQRIGPATAVAVVVLAIGWAVGIMARDDPASRPQSQRSRKASVTVPVVHASTVVRTDPQGRVTRIVGSDPKDVLETFCTWDTSGPITISLTPSGDSWIGDCDRGKGGESIVIRRDAVSGRWYAGDGSTALASHPGIAGGSAAAE